MCVFYFRYAQTVDFEKDQLDIKKKLAKLLGDGVTLRMRFMLTVDQPLNNAAEDSQGV
jgi:hypothetical protein